MALSILIFNNSKIPQEYAWYGWDHPRCPPMWRWRSAQPTVMTQGCGGCGPYCVAHCSCPEMAAVRQAMRLGWPLQDLLRLGRH